MGDVGKLFIFMGVLLVVIGLLITFMEKLPFGLGKLPGDILIKRDGLTLYIPIVSSILLSLIITLLLNVVFFFLSRK
ncbi:conserved hypothetical protein [Thermocrinis albus DSM 14484]|uniref:DUF2905 domain-containing protein n=1 Tax=Thermocrinis albus (strain DSM 14484 / JCM 11386 / HI 11/12) TaxID=638303 RepID=D3SLY6_THEAH|nr:DUF2905 domain-containing protein [Thermocrinis albus]ADC89766.1 conserved hypothetical protein [Thermocrinis albus DSM 14484]